MLRSFNKARSEALEENRNGKFLRYALGEILLVVIGILIALQIDNWNDERLERQQTREYALNLADDIRRDLEMLTVIDAQIRRLIAVGEALGEYTRDATLEELDNVDLLLLTRPMSYRPYSWNRAAMEQLKASGALRQIDSTELVDLISRYEALTLHLDEDYQNDSRVSDEVRAVRDRVIDFNYPGIDEGYQDWVIFSTEDSAIDAYLGYRDSAFYEGLQARQLPLLTQDLAEVRLLTNKSLRLVSLVKPRVHSEFPRLRELAGETIERIETEYGQP